MPMRNSEWFHRRAEMINKPYKIPLPLISRDKQVKGGVRYANQRRALAAADRIEAHMRERRRP